MHRPVPHVPGEKKPSTIFESWGRLVYRWRWEVLATSVLLLGLDETFLLARVTDVSQYALNVVTLIGLGVAIDYSLFVVNRFRDELSSAASREDAVGVS